MAGDVFRGISQTPTVVTTGLMLSHIPKQARVTYAHFARRVAISE